MNIIKKCLVISLLSAISLAIYAGTTTAPFSGRVFTTPNPIKQGLSASPFEVLVNNNSQNDLTIQYGADPSDLTKTTLHHPSISQTSHYAITTDDPDARLYVEVQSLNENILLPEQIVNNNSCIDVTGTQGNQNLTVVQHCL